MTDLRCRSCGLSTSPMGPSDSNATFSCPNCGNPIDPGAFIESPSGESGGSGKGRALVGGVVVSYFKTLFRILTQPTVFFRELPPRQSWAGPLAFALVSHWIGTLSEYTWSEVFGFASRRNFDDFLDRLRDQWGEEFSAFSKLNHSPQLDWFWSGGRVLADPFHTLASILFSAFWIYLGVKLLVPEKGALQRAKTDYASVLRIVAYSWGATILALLPMGGSWLGSLAALFILAIGLRETYAIGTARAWVIALFPKWVVFAIMMVVAVFFAAFLIQLFGLFFLL